MADNGFKINKSVNLNPQITTPTNPVDGDFYYDSTVQSFAYYHNGSWANFDSVGTVGSTLWLTGAQFTPAVVRNSVIKVTGGVVLSHLAGISSSFSAKKITIYNAGTATIVVEPEDANEIVTNNRIQTPTGGSMNLVAGEIAVFVYDIVASRWLLVSISSNAGAQLIATISNPGLVTLHQPSLLPLDGVVLSDGDLDTANGVIGLNSNRAAAIAAPLAAVTALTIDAHANASALVLQGGGVNAALLRIYAPGAALAWYDGSSILVGSLYDQGLVVGQTREIRQYGAGLPDETDFTLMQDDVHLGRRKLHFSKDDGFSNIYNNYLQYTYLGGGDRRGVKFVNQTNTGTGEFWVEATGDGFGGTRTDLILKASTGTDQYITNQQGNLYLNLGQSSSVFAGFGNTGTWEFRSNSVSLWQITGAGASPAGALQAIGTNRLIRSVADPLLAQDAATKNYVDTQNTFEVQNGVINGAFDFWQRGTTIIAEHASAAGTADRAYGPDRWFGYIRDDQDATSTSQISMTRQTFGSESRYALRASVTCGPGSGFGVWQIVQEIDRRIVERLRGKRATLRFKGKLSGMAGNEPSVRILYGTDANTERTAYATSTSTGYATVYTAATLNPTWTGTMQTLTLTTAAIIPVTATEISVVFAGNFDSSFTGDYLEIAEVSLTEGEFAPADYRWAGRTWQGELHLCQSYYEKSYAIDTAPATNTSTDMANGVTVSGGATVIVPEISFKAVKRIIPTMQYYPQDGAAAGNWNEATTPAERTISSAIVGTTNCRLTCATSPGVGTWFYGHWTASAEI